MAFQTKRLRRSSRKVVSHCRFTSLQILPLIPYLGEANFNLTYWSERWTRVLVGITSNPRTLRISYCFELFKFLCKSTIIIISSSSSSSSSSISGISIVICGKTCNLQQTLERLI
jgi:hypothetical protein